MTKIIQLLLIVLAVLISPLNAHAQTQLGSDINGEAAGDEFGRRVSISADGKTLAAGAPYNDNANGSDAGHTRIYQWNGIISQWTQKGADIDGEATDDNSGYWVSLSADGNTVATSARDNDGNGNNSGHTRVYEWDGTSWNQKGIDIDGEAADDHSGYSISLSANGNTVAIGAHNNDGNGLSAGHTRVYNWSGTAWTQKGSDIDGQAAGDLSGEIITLSANGNILAIGARHNNGNLMGSARVYQWNGIIWNQLGSDIFGEATDDRSEYVSLSADGKTLAIGSIWNDGNGSNSGHVRVYEWDSLISSWSKKGADIDGEMAGDRSGFSSSLSADGNIIAIGSIDNSNSNGTKAGHTRVFRWNGSAWIQLGVDIDGEAGGDASGWSVSLSPDGSSLAVGALFNNGNGSSSGHVRVFHITAPANIINSSLIENLGIFPNPTKETIHIEFKSKKVSEIEFKLVDINGRIIRNNHTKSHIGLNSLSMELGKIATGIYYLQLFENDQLVHTHKICKD